MHALGLRTCTYNVALTHKNHHHRHVVNCNRVTRRRQIMHWIDQTLDDMNTDDIMKDVVTESTTAAILQTSLLAMYGVLAFSIYMSSHHDDDA